MDNNEKSPARVEGELTDKRIEEIAEDYQSQHGFAYLGFARAIERALNQRLAVKEGEAGYDSPIAKLSALMAGLEIPPTAIHMDHNFFLLTGRAIAKQAKQSTHPVSDDQQAKDAARLDFLIANELQVWEVNGRYSVHEVTEHHPITEEFSDPRWAIDTAIATTKQEEV